MLEKYYKVLISATSKEEADMLTDTLLNKRLIAGGFISKGESRHWWKDEIEVLPYFIISAYTKESHQDAIIDLVESIAKDEIPGITFFKVDHANANFFEWIESNI